MDKTKLNRFISKYYLNGMVESVAWKSTDDLSVKFVDDTKSLVGEVVCSNAAFPESDFGVNQTSKLRSLLGVLGDKIEIDVNTKGGVASSLNIADSNVEVNYMLSDISIIPKVPVLKSLPPWNLTLNAEEKFIENFVKSCNALNDVKEFAVIAKNEKVAFVVGHSNINTTKVSVTIEPKLYDDMAVTYFSTSQLKEILTANKEAKVGKIEVSDKGLMRVTFVVDDFKSTYYLVSKQEVNA